MSLRIATTLLVGASAGTDPCCKTCEAPKVKYFSVDTPHGHCGECCMDPKHFSIFKIFEKNLTLANGVTCDSLGWPKYDSTVTHGFGPLSMTLDLYDHASIKQDLPAAQSTPPAGDEVPTLGDIKIEEFEKPEMIVTAEESPCCHACEAPKVKYFSVDTPHGHCGECCMDPKHFGIFKIFEKNLTLANGTTCADLGWPKYESTVTHGFGPLSMTLDLYDHGNIKQERPAAQITRPDDIEIEKLEKPATIVTAEESPCCHACEAPKVKYFSVDTPHGHCGECCMDPKHFGIFKIFEKNLTLANGTTCADLGWPKYESTVTHGFGPLSMTLDLYDHASASLIV